MAVSAATGARPDFSEQAWAPLTTIDPRSAGLFRITVGLLLLVHGWQRWRSWAVLCSTDGLMPAELLPASREIPYFPTILTWLEATAWGLHGFAIAALAVYVLFTIGWQTRWMCALSLLVFSSLVHRNPYLVIGADEVIGSFLLWSLLLPLGEQYSVDAWIVRTRTGATTDVWRRSRQCPVAVCGARLQLAMIYLATAWQKSGTTWWAEGTALTRILGLATYQLPGAQFLSGVDPDVLCLATRCALLLEYALPVLILSPFGQPWLRRAAIVGMAGLHAGISIVLDTGLFSLTMFAMIPLLVSTSDWSLVARFRSEASERWCAAFSHQPSRNLLHSVAAGFLMLGLLQQNWNRTFAPPDGQVTVDLLELPWRAAAAAQRWTMFAPDAPAFDAQIQIVARDRAGRDVTVWSGHSRPAFLERVFLQRAALLAESSRRAEGEHLRVHICKYFAGVGAERRGLSRADVQFLEIRATFVPTEPGHDGPQRTICVAHYEPHVEGDRSLVARSRDSHH